MHVPQALAVAQLRLRLGRQQTHIGQLMRLDRLRQLGAPRAAAEKDKLKIAQLLELKSGSQNVVEQVSHPHVAGIDHHQIVGRQTELGAQGIILVGHGYDGSLVRPVGDHVHPFRHHPVGHHPVAHAAPDHDYPGGVLPAEPGQPAQSPGQWRARRHHAAGHRHIRIDIH